MGIREQGYRHWQGTYTGHTLRWWTIALQALRATTLNKTRLGVIFLLCLVVWAPYFFFGLFFFIAPQEFAGGTSLAIDAFLRRFLYDVVRGWGFFAAPIFVATIAAPLVSNDLRSNALYIYLSKPLRRIDYILGKTAAITLFTLLVTLLPNLFVWMMAVSASDEKAPLNSPGEIFFEILGAQLVFLGFYSSVALVVSSFTKQWWTAFIGFLGGYYGLWLVGDLLRRATRQSNWGYLSPADNLNNVAQKLLEQTAQPPDWVPSLLILLALTFGAFGLFFTRIMRIEVAE